MAKFYGAIGFAETYESEPGVWKERIAERRYYGELTRNTRKHQQGEWLNDNLVISNDVSILSDFFVFENLHTMRYVEFMGAKWKIANIEVQYPRLILTTGGLYND